MTIDKEKSHLEQLILKHRELDKQIQEGYTNYLDDAHLVKMKQEKLVIKQQIDKLQKKVT